MNPVRCKFHCNEIVTRKGYGSNPLLYVAKFTPVMDGSEENKQFYHYSPSGSLEIGTITQMPFQVGKEYYLDIIEAPKG